MGRSRSEFSALLKSIQGVVKVYFQPPGEERMLYPCLIYEIEDRPAKYADNLPYRVDTKYTVTVIDADPDSLIPDRVAKLPMSSFNRFFVADGLNHNVFTLYF